MNAKRVAMMLSRRRHGCDIVAEDAYCKSIAVCSRRKSAIIGCEWYGGGTITTTTTTFHAFKASKCVYAHDASNTLHTFELNHT